MNASKQPIYLDIMHTIKHKISKNEYQTGYKFTEAALASDFSCSRITAKRALDELTQEGIIERKKGSGSYLADFSARPDVEEGKNITLIFPHGYMASNLMTYFYGSSDMLSTRGYVPGIVAGSSDIVTSEELISRAVASGCAGIIFYPEQDNDTTEMLTTLAVEDFPIVVIDKHFHGIPVNTVTSDNYEGARAAMQLLYDNGHRNFAFVSDHNINTRSTIKDRFLGYAMAHKENGLKINLDNVVSDFNRTLKESYPDAYRQVISILPLSGNQHSFFADIVTRLINSGITAIFGSNDLVAMYIVKTCEYMGLSVPQDLSIIGFDDHILLQHMGVPITTVRQDFYGVGYQAAELLMKKIDNRAMAAEKIVLPVEVVKRTSIKRLN